MADDRYPVCRRELGDRQDDVPGRIPTSPGRAGRRGRPPASHRDRAAGASAHQTSAPGVRRPRTGAALGPPAPPSEGSRPRRSRRSNGSGGFRQALPSAGAGAEGRASPIVDRYARSPVPKTVGSHPGIPGCREHQAAADPTLGRGVSRLATAFVGDPNGANWAYTAVVDVRPGSGTAAFFSDWQATFDASACDRAGGVGERHHGPDRRSLRRANGLRGRHPDLPRPDHRHRAADLDLGHRRREVRRAGDRGPAALIGPEALTALRP